jgi:hypothetical protein
VNEVHAFWANSASTNNLQEKCDWELPLAPLAEIIAAVVTLRFGESRGKSAKSQILRQYSNGVIDHGLILGRIFSSQGTAADSTSGHTSHRARFSPNNNNNNYNNSSTSNSNHNARSNADQTRKKIARTCKYCQQSVTGKWASHECPARK